MQKAEDQSKVVEAIAIVHGEFEAIHPFREGNARVGRLMADLMALQSGRSTVVFNIEGKPRNKKVYFDAMKEVFVNKDYSHLMRIIEEALEKAKEKGTKEAKK